MLGLRSAQRAKAWFVTLRNFLGRLPFTVLKSPNEWQSDIFLKCKESKGHTQLKLWYVDYEMYIMSTEKSYRQRASRMNARRRKVPIFRWMVREWVWLPSPRDWKIRICTAPEMIPTPKWSPTLKWSPNRPRNDPDPEMIPNIFFLSTPKWSPRN